MTSRGTRVAVALVVLSAAAALAQDAGFAGVAVNPGSADAPAQLIRELDADGGLSDADAGAAPMQYDVAPPQPVAQAEEPEKKEEKGAWDISAALAASIRASYQGATAFPLDSTLTPTTIAPLLTRVRVTPEIHLGGFGLIAEADTATGAITGAPNVAAELPDTVATKNDLARRVPYPAIQALELRKLYLEYKWASGAFRVGQQTSNWGLGLLANDGNKDPEAGDFGQQQFGNLTYRALLAARPLFGKGGAWRAFETALAADLIVRDGFGEFARGDRAFQAVVALRFAKDTENNFGVYAVYRNQRNVFVTDGGRATDVVVVDFAGKWEFLRRRSRSFKLGWELVTINGTTTQARNENAAQLRVAQFGGAIKSAYRVGRTTLYVDGGYATGDQNPGDDRIENFRFDRDFKVGMVLFDHVLAYQTARAAVRASDPSIVGVPPEGADLLGTGGAVTGAWYLFPRVKYGMTDWLDVYGGPLFAFSTARMADAFNTRVGGGTAINALGGRPGMYLGTEIDVGLQARFKPIRELLITATGEGGLFLPGDAFTLPAGGVMAPVGFGRVRLSISI